MNNALHNFDCPPLMSDGRHATDYRPSCYVHSLIIGQNGITNANQMRYFLQHNGAQLMEVNRDYFIKKNMCQSCMFEHVDPNRNDQYWYNYQEHIGYRQPHTQFVTPQGSSHVSYPKTK